MASQLFDIGGAEAGEERKRFGPEIIRIGVGQAVKITVVIVTVWRREIGETHGFSC